MSKVKVYHNPNCGTSRNVVELLKSRGVNPEIVEYLKTPLKAHELKQLLRWMKLKPRELIRSKEKVYDELHLDDPKWTDDQLVEFMAAHPSLMNRPVVVSGENAKLCRPAESVLEMI